jgi:NAD-dependent dihydropyrimidine dehydrogenase PreA subunit
MLKVDKDKCNGDGVCEEVCPVGAATLNEDGKADIDPDMCIECYSCMGTCPQGAIYEED